MIEEISPVCSRSTSTPYARLHSTPSTVARAILAGVMLRQRQPDELAAGVRQRRRPLTLEIRDEGDALAAGLGAQREPAQLVERDAEDLRSCHEIPGAVQRADQGQELAGRVRESGNGPGRLVGLLIALR